MNEAQESWGGNRGTGVRRIRNERKCEKKRIKKKRRKMKERENSHLKSFFVRIIISGRGGDNKETRMHEGGIKKTKKKRKQGHKGRTRARNFSII